MKPGGLRDCRSPAYASPQWTERGNSNGEPGPTSLLFVFKNVMQTPPEITYRHSEPTPAERNYIEKRIAKLEWYCDSITTCSVSVDREQRTADTGDVFRARVRIHVPPKHEIIAEHSPTDSKEELDLLSALKDAFDSAERQLRRLTTARNPKASGLEAKRKGTIDEPAV